RHTAALNGGAQHVLASAGVLVGQPATMNQEPTVVVDEHPQKCAFTASDAREGHERTDEHVANPALVGTFSFVTTEGPRLATQCRAVETTSAEVLADGALRHENAVPRFQN